MSTFEVADTFVITGRGTVITGERVGRLHTGQYLYGPRFGFQVRGIEQFLTPNRDQLERDKVGILVGNLPEDWFKKGDEFSTERPFCKHCDDKVCP